MFGGMEQVGHGGMCMADACRFICWIFDTEGMRVEVAWRALIVSLRPKEAAFGQAGSTPTRLLRRRRTCCLQSEYKRGCASQGPPDCGKHSQWSLSAAHRVCRFVPCYSQWNVCASFARPIFALLNACRHKHRSPRKSSNCTKGFQSMSFKITAPNSGAWPRIYPQPPPSLPIAVSNGCWLRACGILEKGKVYDAEHPNAIFFSHVNIFNIGKNGRDVDLWQQCRQSRRK